MIGLFTMWESVNESQ